MARVTVEDCNKYVPNSFELVVLAAYRSRQIASGSPLLVERDNDKNPVVALREIGDSVLDVSTLRESVVSSYCQFQKAAPQEEELEELLDQELASTSYITEQLFEMTQAKTDSGEERDEESLSQESYDLQPEDE